LDTKSPADYGVTAGTKLKTVKVEAPAERKAGVQVKSVDELVEKLKNEAKVI
ncbi:electron transfer flavoprotein subunit beta/FixA family protein, partial [Acinetobacter baumannii]